MNRNTHYHIILDFTERIATVNTHGTWHFGGISALFLALAPGLFRFPPKRTVANQTHCWTFFSSRLFDEPGWGPKRKSRAEKILRRRSGKERSVLGLVLGELFNGIARDKNWPQRCAGIHWLLFFGLSFLLCFMRKACIIMDSINRRLLLQMRSDL